MSKPRLSTPNSRSFLHQPIQYRQVIHNRNNHQSVRIAGRETVSIADMPTTPQYTQSRLQNLLKPKSHSRNVSNSVSLEGHKGRKMVLSRVSQMGKSQKIKGLKMNSNRVEVATPIDRYLTPIDQHISERAIKLPINQRVTQPNPRAVLFEEENQDIGQEIDNRLQNLISRKLQLVLDQTSKNKHVSQSITSLAKAAISHELQQLITEIKALKSKSVSSEVKVFNQKIRLIQNLMAEQSTESELMKKYFFRLSSSKKKGKVGDFTHLKGRLSEVFRSSAMVRKDLKSMPSKVSISHKPLFNETTNKNSYQSPKLEDYESYRYQQKKVPMNMQPLPRSSYKREYLILKSEPNQIIVGRDHSPFNPNNKAPLQSIYQKDFVPSRADNVDYKGLDAYKNKIKTLKVNYMPKNKLKNLKLQRQSYEGEAQLSRSQSGSPKVPEGLESFNKKMLTTQAQRQYRGSSAYEPRVIKDRQLKDFQYRLKHLFKA